MALPKSVNKKLPEEVIDIIYSFDDSMSPGSNLPRRNSDRQF